MKTHPSSDTTCDIKRIAVLVSGSGSNLQALIEAARVSGFPGTICLVISNKKDAKALRRAQDADIANFVIDHTQYETKAAFEVALQAQLESHDVHLICLAGFMRVLSAYFVTRWQGRILNIHPSLLPAYKGLNVHQRVLEAGERVSGCTVHMVTPDLDEGPILGQVAVEVEPQDTAASLALRILEQEHLLYPRVLAAFCQTF